MKRRHRRGAAAVEFALCFALLWTVCAGVFQFGYAFTVYASLTHAVAAGARYASSVEFDEPDHSFVAAVQNVVVYGSPSGGSVPVAASLTPDGVSVTWTTDGSGVPETITVEIRDYTVDTLFASFRLQRKPRVTVRHAGAFTTPG